MNKRVKIELAESVEKFLDKNPDKKFYTGIDWDSHVIKDTTLVSRMYRLRDHTDGYNQHLNIDYSTLYKEVEEETTEPTKQETKEEIEMERTKILFKGKEELKDWLDNNKGVKLFLYHHCTGHLIHTDEDPYQVVYESGYTEDIDGCWNNTEFFLETPVEATVEATVEPTYEVVSVDIGNSEEKLQKWLDEHPDTKLYTTASVDSSYAIKVTSFSSSEKRVGDSKYRFEGWYLDGMWDCFSTGYYKKLVETPVEASSKELPYDKYYKMFKECTSTEEVDELNKKFQWNGNSLFQLLDKNRESTCKLFPVGYTSINEIEEVVAAPRKTGLVGVKQIECVLPEEGVPEEDQGFIHLDLTKEGLVNNDCYDPDWELDTLKVRVGWFKEFDEEHATKYFKALFNIED